jgi:hypothetical protein
MDDDIYHYDSDGNLTGFSSKNRPEEPFNFSILIVLIIIASVGAWNYDIICEYISSYEERKFPINIVCFNIYWIIKPIVVFFSESYHLITNLTKFENFNFLLWLIVVALFFAFTFKLCLFIDNFVQEKTDYNLNLIILIFSPSAISITIYMVYIAFMVAKSIFGWLFAV